MKTVSDKVAWYNQVETRQWKRLLHAIEISLISVIAIAVIIVMYLYGDGTKLQPILILFTAAQAITSGLLVPIFYKESFKRWHLQLITLGLGSGVAVSAIAALSILSLQLN
ncbi:hypothetical protein [Kangiella shandongensis]|uniref:hypothetical protein n=1 Tax=Kangiella shandongensis TaxID=2763258 RepID=UPI001CBF5739|nr:hypothetical protein [Kangiella shandongensis]